MCETVPGPLAMPGVLIETNRSPGVKDGSKELLAIVRIPLTRAYRLPDEEVTNNPDVMQIRSCHESLPFEGRSLNFTTRSTDGDREYEAHSIPEATEDSQRICQVQEDRKYHTNRSFR